MLSVRELHRIAQTLPPDRLAQQLGPFVLLERPPDEQRAHAALMLGAKRTVAVQRDRSGQDELSMLLELETLMVATVPPLAPGAKLLVGRLPDCDLVLDDPSVSKHHATLTWDGAGGGVMVQDLGSSNGTWINGERLHLAMAVRDGDNLSFGDFEFCFFASATLVEKLTLKRAP